MSFQAYLDSIEKNTGKTPNELLVIAKEKGFTTDTKASKVIDWLKEDYNLGRGHAMAFFHILKNGARISDKHVGSNGAHADESNELRLDGLKKGRTIA